MSIEHPVGKHRYITTRSGRPVRLSQMAPCDVRVRDIVHSLAMQCRYVGHCNRFYSVAEHSMVVSVLAGRAFTSGELFRDCVSVEFVTICALMHDAGEAYQGDQSSPFKEEVPEIWRIQHHIDTIVFGTLGLPAPDHRIWKDVKQCDIQALHIESAQLFDPVPPWVIRDRTFERLNCWEPYEAEQQFGRRVAELYGPF